MIPQKSHFKQNELCGLTGVKPYVLRFWESEFPEITPIQSSSGQKLYEYKDVELVKTIKDLLFDKKMSIEQVKAHLQKSEERTIQDSQTPEVASKPQLKSETSSLKDELKAILAETQEIKKRLQRG